MGKICKVFPGAVVGAIPQDLKFSDEITWVEIGDNVTIRECATINRGTAASGKYKTVIGSNTLIMSYAHVAHDCEVGSNCDGVRETVDIAKKYIADQGFTFEVLFDTEGMASYQYYITGLPSTFFINAEGRLVTYANSMLTYDDLIRGIGFVKGE